VEVGLEGALMKREFEVDDWTSPIFNPSASSGQVFQFSIFKHRPVFVRIRNTGEIVEAS
jgi:hypothetical protein